MLKLVEFRVTNFRNVIDSGPIKVRELTALIGQNESGKSNICEALYKLWPFDGESSYDLNFDWPLDRWEEKRADGVACSARFRITSDSEKDFLDTVFPPNKDSSTTQQKKRFASGKLDTKKPIEITLSRKYDGQYLIGYENIQKSLDKDTAWKWVKAHLPKFVYIHEYDISGQQIELPTLARRMAEVGWNHLTPEEQTIKIILDLAQIKIDDFLAKAGSAEGRTIRSFDKRAASAYLSRKFTDLWKQKRVQFEIDIDGPTLNIFAQDEGFGMPVRLDRRSTGFRWYVSFAWRFTHATAGEFKNAVLLLEEPGIHLHPSGQEDLLKLFETLAERNQVIYTTHLPSLIDPGTPERIRIVEIENHHTRIWDGIISPSKEPMMVIEKCLGLSPSMSSMLGNRRTLIVEGPDDATLIEKLSSVFDRSNEQGLPDDMYLWPAQGASKTPMYAGLMIGHKWRGGVLLDSDQAGNDAAKKIRELYAPSDSFRVLMLGDAAGIPKSSCAIEELLPPEVYVDCVAKAYRIRLAVDDLADLEAIPIATAMERLLRQRGFAKLDKARVTRELYDVFAGWRAIGDLPSVTTERCRKLFAAINSIPAQQVREPAD